MSSHWLDPVWRRVASRIQPYILPRYQVMIRDSTLFATDENPAVSVTQGATNVSLVSNSIHGAPKESSSSPNSPLRHWNDYSERKA